MLGDQRIERHGIRRQGGIGVRDDEGFDLVRGVAQGFVQYGQQGAGAQHGLGAAVFEHEGVVVCRQQGVNRDRHDTGIHRAQKAHRPVAAVVHQEQHALFAAHAAGEQSGGQAADALGQFAVAQTARIVDERGLVRAFSVAGDQVLGKVKGCARRCGPGHSC